MVKVSKKVLEQLETIRSGGTHNMFDYHGVMREAYDNGFYELVTWMVDNKKDYIRGIFQGFEEVQQ